MQGKLRQQLGRFMRRQRGEATYAQFARRVGISDSTLQRLEMGQQNITLDTLERICERLKCRVSDIFND